MEQGLAAYLAILDEVNAMKKEYAKSRRIEDLKAGLLDFARRYDGRINVWDLLLNVAEEYISGGDRDTGWAILLTLREHEEQTFNQTTLFLRLAEYYLENGDAETGTGYLIRLCTDVVSNYEESIAFNDLTPVWEKYRHLVEGKVPPSVPTVSAIQNSGLVPLSPADCSMGIGEILALPEDEILSALSEHLGQMSANGSALNSLNKWEKAVFYADELCMEVNSGGFEHYLYYHGTHFEKAYQALETMDAPSVRSLMDTVRSRFPRGRIPKSQDAIQNTPDRLEDKAVDFEDADDIFYDTAEKELLLRLLRYVLENKNHFR